MKNFILKLSLFLLIFFLLDKCLLFLRNRLPDRELDKRLETVINGKINADIVIFGSSKPARDIIASQLSDSLNLKAFNMAYPGSNIEFQKYLLEEFIQNKNKKPKLVILGVDAPNNLVKIINSRFRLDRLYPLVKYERIRNTLIERGEKNKYLSDAFIIHQLTIGSFDIQTKKFNNQDTIYDDGSMPISYQHKDFKKVFAVNADKYDTARESSFSIECFKNFIKLCEDNDIKILICLTPNYGTFPSIFLNRIKELAPGKPVMTYDTLNEAYKKQHHFFDNGHLTRTGAEIFTNELADYINKAQMLDQD